MSKPRKQQTVTGRVTKTFYSTPGFSAGVIRKDSGQEIRFAGKIMAMEGDRLRLEGHFESTPYGMQLKVSGFQHDLPTEANGLAHYLATHPKIKGIGPAKAALIAKQFGADFDAALSENAEAIAKAARVPVAVIENLRDEWTRTRAFNTANTWLAAFELTHRQITTLTEKYGNSVVGVFKENPYRLIRDIKGYGFKKVDKIARRMGVAKEHPERIRAGILQCVNEELDSGHTWTEYRELLDKADALLLLDSMDGRECIEAKLDHLIREKLLACESLNGWPVVAHFGVRRMEMDLADIFRRGRGANPHFQDVADLVTRILDIAPSLNPGQKTAVERCLRHGMTVVTGGAGVGKTFLVRSLCDLYENEDRSVLLCAPTGKAAKRMEESTGRAAQTIHRLLGYNGREFQNEGPIETDLLVIDEVSMCDVSLLWHLLRAIDLDVTSVVLVGDHNQLPPIGAGNVLRDLIKTEMVPVSRLTEVVRQAGELKRNCSAILDGRIAKAAVTDGNGLSPWQTVLGHLSAEDALGRIVDLYTKQFPAISGLDILRDVQVLTPIRSKGPLSVAHLNRLLQRLIQKRLFGVEAPKTPPNRRPPFLLHDKVIQRRNNYDLGVMNGTVGFVADVHGNGDLQVDFDGELVLLKKSEGHLGDLDLAYALTIHQCQGSEFPVAVVVCHKSHSFMHHRNLLYTGVTRAKRSVVIIGDHWGVKNCAEKEEASQRRTFLSQIPYLENPPTRRRALADADVTVRGL